MRTLDQIYYDITKEEEMAKTLHNTDMSKTKENVSDVVSWGAGDIFQLLAKSSSEKEGWMKSTKAMSTTVGCLVQVTTQQRNPDGSYALAEALTFVPGVTIGIHTDNETGDIVSRSLLTLDDITMIQEQEKKEK